MTSRYTMSAFVDWTKELGNGWRLDEVMLANHGTFLLWRPAVGFDGYFVEIEAQADGTGIVRVGTYDDAVQSITDGLFHLEARRRFGNMSEALCAVMNTNGWSGLVKLCQENEPELAPWKDE